MERMGKLTGMAFLVILLVCPAFSQVVTEWPFEGVKLDRPRTLRLPGKHLDLQKKIETDSLLEQIYQSIINDVRGRKIPEENSLIQKRIRSNYAKNASLIVFISGDSTETIPGIRDSVISCLNDLSPEIPSISAENPVAYLDYQWHSRILINYLTTYDILLGAGINDTLLARAKKNLIDYTNNLYNESSRSFYGYSFINNSRNNHGLMTAAAIGMGAVVLDSASTASSEWLSLALTAIDKILWDEKKGLSSRKVLSGYSEGPYYFKYAFQNCLPFFRSLANVLPDGTYNFYSGNEEMKIRHPYYDPDYDSLYRWAEELLLPDGSIPPIGDTYRNMYLPELKISPSGKRLPGSDKIIPALKGTNDLRVEFISSFRSETPNKQKGDFISPSSGNILLRNEGLYLHINTPNGKQFYNSGGHNQGDESSYILYRNGKEIAMDPGYVKYYRRHLVSGAESHNLILVNGKGPVSGNPGKKAGGETLMKHYFKAPGIRTTAIATAYENATINRRFLVLNDTLVIIADEVISGSKKIFDLQLHTSLPADSSFTKREKNMVEFNNERILFFSSGANDSLITSLSPHEFAYDSIAYHQVVKLQKESKQAGFLTVFTGGAGDRVKRLKDQRFSGIQYGKKIVLSKPDTFIRSFEQDEFIITTNANLLVSTKSETGDWSDLYLEGGNNVSINGQKVLEASRPIPLWIKKEARGNYKVKVSGETSITIFTRYNPTAVVGKSVRSWEFFPGKGELKIETSGKGEFYVEASLITGTEPHHSGGQKLKIFPVSTGRDFLIQAPGPGNYEISLIDGSGRLIANFSQNLKEGFNRVSIPSNLKNGLFLCQVRGGKNLTVNGSGWIKNTIN